MQALTSTHPAFAPHHLTISDPAGFKHACWCAWEIDGTLSLDNVMCFRAPRSAERYAHIVWSRLFGDCTEEECDAFVAQAPTLLIWLQDPTDKKVIWYRKHSIRHSKGSSPRLVLTTTLNRDHLPYSESRDKESGIDWDNLPYGEESDRKIAEEIGVSRLRVADRRRSFGIAPKERVRPPAADSYKVLKTKLHRVLFTLAMARHSTPDPTEAQMEETLEAQVEETLNAIMASTIWNEKESK